MSIPTPPTPSPGLPPESEPASPPSVPDVALWGDSDVGPTSAKGKRREIDSPADQRGDPLATIGHIGRYALKYRIGEGGLGTVYAAHDPLLSRLIAIKTLNLEIAADQRPAFNTLFLNEARAAAGLSHPNIVTVFDAGVSDDNAYIAMELLKGRDLRQLRQEGWKPTATQAALIVRRVADALAYAHSKGVIHRDIKPANIFMVGRTQPRVLDFGIARVAHQHEAQTGDDVAGGSPYYMSPEQVRQQPGDRRTDVFSLGVVLYELLTDQKPFRGGTVAEITHAVLTYDPPPANFQNKDVPKALAEIAARAIEKDPDLRFRSARALSRELRHWLEENGQVSEGAEPKPSHRSRTLWTVGTAAGILIAAGAWWMSMWSHKAAADTEIAAVSPSATEAPPPVIAAAAPAIAPAASTAPAPAAMASAPVPVPATIEAIAIADSASAAAAAAQASAAAAAVATPPAAVAAPPEPARPAKGTRTVVASAETAAQTPAARPKDKVVKESARERKAREARERAAARAAPVAVASGVIRLAVSPWGHVEVDGTPVGSAPPLTEITLSEGMHQIVIRNEDFPPYSVGVNISASQPVTIRHKFGS